MKQRGAFRDRRVVGAVGLAAGIAVLGVLVNWMPGRAVVAESISSSALVDGRSSDPFASLVAPPRGGALEREELPGPESSPTSSDVPDRAAKAVLAGAAREIRHKRYDEALRLLDGARPQLRIFPQSYLLIGRALEGKRDYQAARDFYNAALDRDPMLADAYWGAATTSEALGDLHTALGGMRSYLHVVGEPDPNRLKVAQARSAIWEWEAQLGRGPWGPTKGVIPGVLPEQMRRDDRGVAIMMPLPETKQPDGSTKFEIKHQDKFEMFKK